MDGVQCPVVEDMKATGHPRLFLHLPAGTGKDGEPNGLEYGCQLSRQFAAYLKPFKIEKGAAFHAFRHTVNKTCRGDGAKDNDRNYYRACAKARGAHARKVLHPYRRYENAIRAHPNARKI